MAWMHMAPKWAQINALLGGTSTMREAREAYLPKHEHEANDRYNARIKRAALTNLTELTLESLVGKPFSDPLKLNEDVPSEIVDMEDDIDLQGNSIHSFCRLWMRTAIAKSFAHVLVAFPSLTEEERAVRTAADDVEDERRPYWMVIQPENVISAHAETIKGVDTLTHVRVLEETIEPFGFAEVLVRRIREYNIGTWRVWREVPVKKNSKKTEWIVEDEGTIDLPFIPIHTFYANRTGLMTGKPPLEDLGYLNVQHWQLSADLFNNLTVANFPMLAVSGAHDAQGNVLAIGPNQLLGTRNENGKFYYVEHSGKAIKSGEDRLSKLEQDMAAYGAEFLRKQPGAVTATAKALDSAEATSPLQDMTLRFVDSVQVVLGMTMAWFGKADRKGGTVEITTDFGPEEVSDVDMRTLNEARRNRDLGRKQYLGELRRRGTLADDFNEKDNLKELQNEPNIDSPFATGGNVAGSAGTQDSGAGEEGGEDQPGQPAPVNPARGSAEEDD
jgi:hypothetical protein